MPWRNSRHNRLVGLERLYNPAKPDKGAEGRHGDLSGAVGEMKVGLNKCGWCSSYALAGSAHISHWPAFPA